VNYDGDPYTPAAAHDPAVVEQVRASTAVFLGGGDQMRYVRTLLDCVGQEAREAHHRCVDTPLLAAVREVLDRGGVVAGVSAGLTAQQGPDMITGGESYQAWRDGASPGYLDDATELGFVPHGGLGFFDEALLDSHFTTWAGRREPSGSPTRRGTSSSSASTRPRHWSTTARPAPARSSASTASRCSRSSGATCAARPRPTCDGACWWRATASTITDCP